MPKSQLSFKFDLPVSTCKLVCRRVAQNLGWKISEINETQLLCEEPFSLSFNNPIKIQVFLVATSSKTTTVNLTGSNIGFGPVQSGHLDKQMAAFVSGVKTMATQSNFDNIASAADENLAGPSSREPVKILFLAAEPTDLSHLRLGEELREIQEQLQLAKLRERFELHQRLSARPTDISQALLDVQPRIVHFSGHGTASGALCFENLTGEMQPVEPDALAALFQQFTEQVSCVVLNACYSEIQANAIAQHIEYVIGMHQAMGDKAAIAFATGFYQALGAGRHLGEAYKLGCVQIRLQGIPAHLTPVLIQKGQVQR